MYQSTLDFSLQDAGYNTSLIKLFLSNKIHFLSIIIMYLHISLSALGAACSMHKNLLFRAALPLFTVHYAQHWVHRQNTKHLQHIIDFEALPALIDLPQRENKMQRQMGQMQDSRKTQAKETQETQLWTENSLSEEVSLSPRCQQAYTGKGSFYDSTLFLLAFFATQG